MISVFKGNVQILGTVPEIVSDFSLIARAVRQSITPELGEEKTDKLIDEALRCARLSDDEIESEAEKAKAKLFDKLFGFGKEGK